MGSIFFVDFLKNSLVKLLKLSEIIVASFIDSFKLSNLILKGILEDQLSFIECDIPLADKIASIHRIELPLTLSSSSIVSFFTVLC